MTATVNAYYVLAEWDFSVYDPDTETTSTTTHYWSTRAEIEHGGNTYVPRILQVSGLSSPYMDRKERTFGEVTLTLANEADDWSSNFPFKVLNGIDDFEDKNIRVYIYNALTDTKTLLFWGITKRPSFDPENLTVDLSASFIWDAIDIEIPSIKLGHRCPYAFGGSPHESQPGAPSAGCPYDTYGTPGFTSCDKSYEACDERGMLNFFGGWTKIAPTIRGDRNNAVDRETIREAVVPLVYASAEDVVKPEIVRAKVIGDELFVNFILTGVHPGYPAATNVLTKDKVKLFGRTPATDIVIKNGAADQAAGRNKNYWPTNEGHSYVCWVAARFPLTKDQVDTIGDDVAFHAIRTELNVGTRPTLRTGSTAAGLVYVLEDILRDSIFGLGLPGSYFDASALAAAHTAVNAKFPTPRVELDKPDGIQDLVTQFLATFHGYITWNNGTMQIGAKTDSETSIATFGTGGRDILVNNYVECEEEDFENVINELQVTYRDHQRHKGQFVYYDTPAQIKAGNGVRKKTTEEIFLIGIADEAYAMVSAATYMREEINANLKIRFKCATEDGLDILPGKIITVNSEHIWTDVTTFRVIGREYDYESQMFEIIGHVYVPAVYANNADPLYGDVLRGGGDHNQHGRAPNVENFDADIVDSYTDDDNSEMETIECTWDYPSTLSTVDADDDDPEPSVYGVQVYWRYENERKFNLRPGPVVKYPGNSCKFDAPHHPRKQVECWAVSLGKNGGHGYIGYMADPDHVTAITEDINDLQNVFDVEDSTKLVNGAYTICDYEINKIASIGANEVTLEEDPDTLGPIPDRIAYFDTIPVAHTDGTEFAVAIPSYPTAIADMENRRYTLATVSGVVARQRRRGVRVKWTNLAAYDVEKYFVYWSVNGSLDNLDTFVVDWQDQDPKTPPAGINLIKAGKLAHVLIPQEDIDTAYGGDATGVDIQVRVTAKIKNNYSSALSALAGASHANKPLYAPGDPVLGDLTFKAIPGNNRVRVVGRVFFDTTKNTTTGHTAEEAQATHAGLRLQKWDKDTGDWELDALGEPLYVPKSEAIENASDRYCDVDFTLHRGSKWRIVNAFLANDAGRRRSNIVNVSFHANDQQDEIASITDLTIAAFGSDETINSIEEDSRTSDLLITFTQPATPVALGYIKIQKKRVGTSKWRRVALESLIDDDEDVDLQTTGAKKLRHEVSHGKDANMDYRCRLIAADGSLGSWSPVRNNTSGGEAGGGIEDTVQPGQPSNVTMKFSNGHLRVKWKKPTTGRKTIVFHEIEIANDSSFSGGSTKWLLDTNPETVSTGTSPVYATTTTTPTDFGDSITVGDTNKLSIAIRKRELNLLFGSTSTLYARVRAYNESTGGDQQGDWSTSIGSLNLSGADDGSLDTTAPDISLWSGTPIIRHNRKGIRVRVNHPPHNIDGFHRIVKYGWVIQSADGDTYMTEDGTATTSRSAAEFYTTTNKHLLTLKRSEITNTDLRAGMIVHVRVFNTIDNLETASVNGASLFNVLPSGATTPGYKSSSSIGELEKDAYNDDDGITTKRKAHSDVNIIEGGGFYNGRGPNQYNAASGDDAQAGQQWRTGLAEADLATSSNLLTTTLARGWQWSQTNHRAQCSTSGAYLAAKIGKLASNGRYLSFCMLVGSSGGGNNMTALQVYLAQIIDGTSVVKITGAEADLDGGLVALPSTASPYQFLGGYFKVPNFTATAGKLWLVVKPTFTGGTTYFDDIGLFFGRDVRPWSPGQRESQLDAVTNVSNITAFATAYSDYGSLNDGLDEQVIGGFSF
jgi:hypothetical protein